MSASGASVVLSVLRQSDAKFYEWNSFWKKNIEPLALADSTDKDDILLIVRSMEDIYQEICRSQQRMSSVYSRPFQNGGQQIRSPPSISPQLSLNSDVDFSIHLGTISDAEEKDEVEELVHSFEPGERRGTLTPMQLPPPDLSGSPSGGNRSVNKKAALKNYLRSSSVQSSTSAEAGSNPSSRRISAMKAGLENDAVSLDGQSLSTDQSVPGKNSRHPTRARSPSSVSMGNVSTTGTIMTSNYFQTVENYSELDLKPEVIQGLELFASKDLTLTQKRAIAPLLEGRNVIMEAPERSGKCAVCTTTILQRLDTSNLECQIVICTADKDSTERFRSLLKTVGQYVRPRMHVCDSSSVMNDIKRLKSDRQIVIATPETLEKLCAKRVLYLKEVKMFVIDDAVSMKNSQNAIRDVFIRLPEDVQVVVFAPKIPPAMYRLLKTFVLDPVCIMVDEKEWAASTSHAYWHGYYNVRNSEWKLDTLKALFKSRALPYTAGKSLVVCPNQPETQLIVTELKKAGFVVYNMDQKKNLPEEFLTKTTGILVMTLTTLKNFSEKMGNLRLIVNYGLPPDIKDYIYTLQHLDYPQGKYKGYVVNFVTPGEMLILQAIHDYLNITIEQIDSSVFSELKRYPAKVT